MCLLSLTAHYTPSNSLPIYNADGKVLSQTDYLYNAKADSFAISNQYIYTWYDNGYLKSDTQVSSSGSAVRNEYKYNDQLLGIEKVTTRRAKGATEFVNYRKGEYDYDKNGNMILEIIYTWQDNAWSMSSRTTAEYDGNNFRTGIEIWKLQKGVWVGTDKQDSKYNKAGKNTLLISYSWERKEPGKFAPFSRVTNIFMKDTIPVTQDIDYFNLDDNDWTGNFKDKNNVDRYNVHASKEFDSRDRITLSFAEKLIGDKWFRGSHTDYVYTDNADGSYECVKSNKVRSQTDTVYRLSEIVTTRVDAAGRTVYYYDNYLPNKKLSSEWSDTYDAKGHNISREEFRYDTDGNRNFYIKAVNTFDEWGNIIETYNWKGKANEQGINDSWIYSSHFTYNYEMNGTIRTDKRRYKYVAATESWATDFGDGADFDFTVPVSDIVIPTGYNAEYMQTAKYSYKGDGEGWDITKYTYFYSKNEQDGINDVIAVQGKISFSNNILRVNGGTTVENSVYSTEGRLVYSGTSHEENLGNLIRGIYVVRSIVDGKASVMKVVVK